MKVKNEVNAFTLMELMAVLIVLAIIFLIIFPMVDDILLDSDKKAFARSVEGLEKAAKLNYRKDDFIGNRHYVYKDNTLTLVEVELVSKNEVVKTEGLIENGVGEVYLDDKGNTSLTVYNDTWCATKTATDKIITIEEKTEDNCIIQLGQTFTEVMTGNSQVAALDPDHNLRYVGEDPDNYVKFNNELWRIIGVFNGQAKIIKDDYYDTDIEWDSNQLNNWSTATLSLLWNDETNGASYINTIKTNNPTSYGYIDLNHEWNIGGAPDFDVQTRSDLYTAERSDTKSSVMDSHLWTGAIGLMYPSDYGYSSSGSSETCGDTKMIYWSNESAKTECAKKSWLYDLNNLQWTLTPISEYTMAVFVVIIDGQTGPSVVYGNGLAARPVLYLKSNVKIVDGKGTEQEPYELGM